MKKYALNIDDRKVLVSRLMELTGLHSRYTFMPRCAYIVGNYTVEKEGTLVIEDNAAPEIIRTLLDEGIIREEGAETPETSEPETACGETTESECEESDETVDSTEDIDWMLCACSEREAVPDRHWRHRRRGARICLVSLLPAVHLAPYVWNSVPLIQWFAGCTEDCLTARSPDNLSLRNLQLI